MNKEELLPHLNQFITVTLTDGSNHSGYISNVKEIQEGGEDLVVQLVNGLFVETVRLEDITEITFPAREETTSLPVIDLAKGYEQNGEGEAQ
ncbi:MAG: hypothetical protein IIY52_05730 [Solobacterium sp.]|nr:hypothetical protein [Solobacterium sp.]